ncbi:hypothetical protein [Myroides odoratimimus]|uniref:hypothetical protein n=1 Tax=Myroides odoratimimus TaxID=76832 RepID=UPI002575CA89|nr:hypothetical protein [Myroides odoratimimus]MDM1092709.1 hypothetical protein [Myroides odoratimimus]
MKKIRYSIVALGVTALCFAQDPQEKTINAKDSLPTSVQKISEVNPGNKVSLQEYVEELYINTCKLYNRGAVPLVDSGDYDVLLVDKKGSAEGSKFVKSKDLALLKIEEVKEIKYEKSKQTDMMYGTRGGAFGIVVITK